MHLRFFTLLEQLQKLDDHLRLAQSRSRPDLVEIGHLSTKAHAAAAVGESDAAIHRPACLMERLSHGISNC
ncbi:hypothetical protein ACQEPB_05020 [Novosphingobium fluoreni]|uniref:hypothetical protein n=1 Tax=Novosphingobium fluoreni TaxID=1391222 RepID=UPI003DA02DCD